MFVLAWTESWLALCAQGSVLAFPVKLDLDLAGSTCRPLSYSNGQLGVPVLMCVPVSFKVAWHPIVTRVTWHTLSLSVVLMGEDVAVAHPWT